jgi:hypothetical protein
VCGDQGGASAAFKFEVQQGLSFEGTFEKGGSLKEDSESHVVALERKVGQLAVENDFLKKSWEGYLKRSGGK